MEALKAVLATLCYFIGGVYLTSIISGVFSWFEFIGGIICFVLAYYTWPSKKRGHRHFDNNLLDILEIVIELPFELLGWFFKFIGRLFRGKDGGVDLDIDF